MTDFERDRYLGTDPDSRDALVSAPSRDYLWILARPRRLDPARRDALVGFARERGYDRDALLFAPQGRNDPALAAP